MRKIRILFFLNSAARGGVEEVVLSLVKGLSRDRFEVHLAAPEGLLRSLEAGWNGCAVQTLPIRLVSWKQVNEMIRLVRYVRRNRIDIVSPHMFMATLFAAPLARLAGAPVVIETTHGPEAWRRTRWKCSFLVDRLIERFVTANIAVSQANREYLVKTKHYPAYKVHVVENGRDLDRYSGTEQEARELRRRYGLHESDRVIAVVGRLEEQKGHRYLMRALPSLTQRFPNLKVLCIGEGRLRGELEGLARALGLQENVVFAGQTENVAPFYQAAEFVVLPSLYEGMPLAAIEAGAASRAVVATAVDGSREVVDAGVTGYLVPPACPGALADAIARLLDRPETARAMGAAGRVRVVKVFSLDRQIENTSKLYEDLYHPAR